MNHSTISFIIGFLALFIGLAYWNSPSHLNHEGAYSQEGIVIAHSEHLKQISTTIDLVTTTNPQFVNINYSYTPTQQKNGTIAIILPYDGEFVKYPSEWQVEKFPSGSTLIFKNITCNANQCLPDNENLRFNITGTVNSFSLPYEHLQIQFSNFPLDQSIRNFTAERSDPTDLIFGWNNVDAQMKVTIDKEFDQLDTMPEPRLSTHPDPEGGNNIVLNWKVDSENSVFLAQYSRYADRSFSETRQTVIGFALGTFVSMIASGIAFNQSERDQRKLQNFIQIQRHIQDANTAFVLKNYENAKQSYDLAIKKDALNIDPILLAGNSFYEMKRYDDAIPYYEKILKINSKHVGALNNIGACLAGLGKHKEAIEYYLQVFDIDTNHRDSINNMGASILDLGFPECAEPYFDESLNIDKKDAMSITNKAKVLISLEKYEDALKYCDSVLEIKPDHIDALHQKSITLFNLKKFDEMISCCNVILHIDAKNKEAKYNKAFALIVKEKYQEAMPLIEEYLVFDPQKSAAYELKARCLDGIGTKISDKAESEVYFKDALYFVNKALDLEPDSLETQNNKAVLLGKLGYHKESLDLIEKLIEKKPNDVNLLLNKSLALIDMERKTDALACFDLILSIDKNNQIVLEKKGRLLVSLGNYKKSIDDCFDPLLGDSKNDLNLLHLKAEALRKDNQNESAIIIYDRILRINPDDTVALNDKGLCLMNLQQYQEAIDVSFDETLRIDTKNIYALINKGACLTHLKKYAESIRDCYDKVLENDARNSQALYNKYWSLLQLGRNEEAILCLHQSEKYKEIEDRKKSKKL